MILTSNQSWISDGHQLLPTSSAHIYSWTKTQRSTEPQAFTQQRPNMLHVTTECLHPKDGDVGVFSTRSRGNRRGAWQCCIITRQTQHTPSLLWGLSVGGWEIEFGPGVYACNPKHDLEGCCKHSLFQSQVTTDSSRYLQHQQCLGRISEHLIEARGYRSLQIATDTPSPSERSACEVAVVRRHPNWSRLVPDPGAAGARPMSWDTWLYL